MSNFIGSRPDWDILARILRASHWGRRSPVRRVFSWVHALTAVVTRRGHR